MTYSPLSTVAVWLKVKIPEFKNIMNSNTISTPAKPRNGFGRFSLFIALAALALICTLRFVRGDGAPANYTVHEWGTFTSVQGGNGELLRWRPLQSSELPNFVYDWARAGLNRGSLIGPKGGLFTLQRMETPVMYFYAEQPMSVDVNVAFPKGFITEWYPQADQIGPTFPTNTNRPTAAILQESRAVWRNLEILSGSTNSSAAEELLPQDSSGSHYFAARETHANMVRTGTALSTNDTKEIEKFIFYRGAGSFTAPLRVTVDSNEVVTVENTGAENLMHLFLLNIHDGVGAFAVLDELAASNSASWSQLTNGPAEHWTQYPLQQFQAEIAFQMQNALASQGLFPDEAKAMVNTWKDSWFTEDGVRVLYILPRAWTDETLPLTLTPAPAELTRVMVGRAEIITPDAETNLLQLLTKAADGDTNAQAAAHKQLEKFGPFAEPALRLAVSHSDKPEKIYQAGDSLIQRKVSQFE
jgi:hypothetical protein